MPTHTCLLTNCLIMGEDGREHATGWTRNIISTRLGHFAVELFQARDLISGTNWASLRGKGIGTTQLIASTERPVAAEELELLRGAVMHSLTLATGSLIGASHWENDDGERLEASIPAAGFTNYFRPTIDTHDGAAVRSFLECCYAGYPRVSRVVNLPVAMAYYAHSLLDGDPIEIALVKSFVCLEHLKHTYATRSGYPFIKGRFRKHGSNKMLSFEDLLRAMLADKGMAPVLGPLVDLRNEIIHSGLSGMPYARQWELYGAAQDILQEYLLRLFDYRGYYFRYSTLGAVMLA